MGISLVENASKADGGEMCQQQKARWADLSDEGDEESCDEEYAMRRQRASSKKKADLEKKEPEMQNEASTAPSQAAIASKSGSKSLPSGGMKWCVKASKSAANDAGQEQVDAPVAQRPRKWSEESAQGGKDTRGRKGSGKGLSKGQGSSASSRKKEKPQKGGKKQGQFIVGIEEDPLFRVGRRLLGPSGQNMKEIAEVTGSRLRLRGRGSWFLEGPNQEESADPLMLCVSSPTEASYLEAATRIEELLLKTYVDFRVFCEKAGWEIPDLRVRRNDGARKGSR